MSDLFEIPKEGIEQRLALQKKDNSSIKKYTLDDLHKDYKDQTLKMAVTSPHYDDIGKVLKTLNIEYESYKGNFECTILFLNCGTSDHIPIDRLKTFVTNGGCLYASDHTSSIISQAFPREFDFAGNIGDAGRMNARVLDQELSSIIGETIEIHFDMGVWSVLNAVPRGKVILQSETTRKPLMVMLQIGSGKIFYTCFHNHAQASRAEQILLQLLVLKQVSTVTGTTLERASQTTGVSLVALRDEMKQLKRQSK